MSPVVKGSRQMISYTQPINHNVVSGDTSKQYTNSLQFTGRDPATMTV